MYGTMAISIYTDCFSSQKVNWDKLFNVCRPKQSNRHKGDMNGVQNILYAWHFRWRMLNLLTHWIVCRTWFCWIALRTNLYKPTVSANYSEFLKQADATYSYSELSRLRSHGGSKRIVRQERCNLNALAQWFSAPRTPWKCVCNWRSPVKKKTLRGFGPLANYADRATAASWRSSTNFCG
jgi:hypothetical protein